MSPQAVRAVGLSKRFRLGKPESYKSLRESLVNAAKAPWRAVSGSRSQPAETFWALRDLDFSVDHGEVLGIIGRNGAGKSTLLKILSRITEPTRGYAEVHGRVGSLLEVGSGFHPELTGRENIYLNGAILGMKKDEIERKFDEIVAFAEIEQFLDTAVKHFSSGMYMRLAFAVAAHLEPEILLVDEVLAVGDLAFQSKCLAKMKDVSGTGRTVLFVSHNMGAIQRLCPRCLMLDNGTLVKDGPTDEVIRAYIAKGTEKTTVFAQPPDPARPIQLRRAFSSGDGVSQQRDFHFNEEASIVIEYQVHREVANCAVWLGIRTVEQVWVLGTSDVDCDASGLALRSVGYYRTTLKLPRQWLNAGMYEIVVGVARHAPLTSYDRAEVGTFRILDTETPSRLRTGQSRPGVLQPFLEWTTKPADEPGNTDDAQPDH